MPYIIFIFFHKNCNSYIVVNMSLLKSYELVKTAHSICYHFCQCREYLTGRIFISVRFKEFSYPSQLVHTIPSLLFTPYSPFRLLW